MKWAGQERAKLERDARMLQARECRAKHQENFDPVYLEMVKIHVRVARTFNRHAWKGPQHDNDRRP